VKRHLRGEERMKRKEEKETKDIYGKLNELAKRLRLPYSL
jgi:hypothetical protein